MVAKRPLTVVMVVLTVMPAASSAFDGDRRGIVLGGGLGLPPMTRWSAVGYGENMAGFGVHVFAGYAWDERDFSHRHLNLLVSYLEF